MIARACAGIMRSIPSIVGVPGAVGALTRIVMITLLFGVLYLGAVILLHRGCAPLYQFVGLLREMLPSGRFSRRSRAVAATADAVASEALH